MVDAQGADVARLPTGSGDVTGVTYTDDGAFLMATGADGTVHVWDATSDELAFRLTGPGGKLYSIAAAPRQGSLVVGGLAGTFELTCEVCVSEQGAARAGRGTGHPRLTADEKRRFLAP